MFRWFAFFNGLSIIGASVLGIRCSDGIVLACESSAQRSQKSASTNDRWIEKIFPLSASTVLCSAGCGFGPEAVEFDKLLTDVREEIMRFSSNDFFRQDQCSELNTDNIYCLVTKLIRHKYPLAHVLIAGMNPLELESDSHNNFEYKLYEVLPGGTGLESQTIAVAGSDGTAIVALLDEYFPKDSSITVEQAVPRIRRVLKAAMKWDNRLGGQPILWTLASPDRTKEMETL